MKRLALVAFGLVAVLAVPLLAGPAAADVNQTLIAFDVGWHLGSENNASQPTIQVQPGDVLRLRIENHDGFQHTFTFPHSSIEEFLAPGSPTNPTVVFVNITTTSADVGKWQFYCAVGTHSTGTYPNRVGMVGWIQVGNPTPPTPSTPGFETVLVIAALVGVAAAVRITHRRK